MHSGARHVMRHAGCVTGGQRLSLRVSAPIAGTPPNPWRCRRTWQGLAANGSHVARQAAVKHYRTKLAHTPTDPLGELDVWKPGSWEAQRITYRRYQLACCAVCGVLHCHIMSSHMDASYNCRRHTVRPCGATDKLFRRHVLRSYPACDALTQALSAAGPVAFNPLTHCNAHPVALSRPP